MIRSAAATPSCAAVVTPSSHQSARDNRRTIAPVTASRADIGLWFALVFPSSSIVLKYLGWESTIAYAIVVALIVAFRPRPTDRLSDRSVWWLAILTIALVAVAYALVYPVANTHTPGAGSDDDDALNVATRRY